MQVVSTIAAALVFAACAACAGRDGRPSTNPPGYNGHLELRVLEQAGITPRQLLDAATRVNAELFGLGRELGTIEPGKRASLLLLRADPLASTTAYDTIEHVIVDGRVVPRASLAADHAP